DVDVVDGSEGLALGQEVEPVGGGAAGEGNRARASAGAARAGIRCAYTTLFRSREAARQRGATGPDRAHQRGADGVGVVEIDVGERQGAAGFVGDGVAGGAGDFGDVVRAGPIHRQHRRIIGAGDGDGDRLRRGGGVRVGDGDVVDDSEGLALGQEGEPVVGGAEGEGNRATAGAGAVGADI